MMTAVHGMYTRLGRVFQFILYSLSVIFGVLTILWPVPSISGVIGLGLTYTYGVILSIGGLGCIWGTIWPNFKVEIPFLFPLATGWLVYAISLWGVYIDRIYHPTIIPPSYGPAIAAMVVFTFYLWRAVWLITKARELVKKADSDARLSS